jgi:hypothetical protein
VTTTVLRADVDLRAALESVRRDGATYVRQALEPDFLTDLLADVVHVPFTRMPREEGRARQGGDQFRIPAAAMSGHRAVDLLGQQLTAGVRANGPEIPGCSSWTPNEVYVQRYWPGDLGITPHLDLKRYRYLVAVFTADGSAPFTICKNRSGDPLVTWTATSGSLVLLRGPGFDDADGHRPLHSVGGPTDGARLSVSYRMDTSIPA